eukprot:358929-Chlamydomonas_euryale.AAC.1
MSYHMCCGSWLLPMRSPAFPLHDYTFSSACASPHAPLDDCTFSSACASPHAPLDEYVAPRASR